MKFSQLLDQGLSLALMSYLKQVEQTRFCGLRPAPPPQRFPVSLVVEFDLFQSSQSASDVWSKVAIFTPYAYNNFAGGDAHHGKPP
jgi:hypothetical protein